MAKRKWAGLKFSAPPPTLAWTNEIRYAYRTHQDAQKSLLDQLPASNRKCAILTTSRHFEPFHVSVIRVLVLNYLSDQLLLGFCFILTPVTSIIIKKTFDFPNAVAAAPPQRWPPRHETRNPHNSCIHHPNVMKRNTHVRHGRTVNNIWFSEVGVVKRKWAGLKFSAPPPTLA